ncbi:ribonuclease P protein component [Stappia sp. ES.058]|uniref:ribonuclease P protein component n=1 Tax=Stappia sp. ES.058 TaxID=1881061 RepID=UPI00087C4283|nr:ribonuclease P protein component [Stappia sp. ES.058]SDT89268.1 ribonuclease P protein component [Stappia sp. ES.058]
MIQAAPPATLPTLKKRAEFLAVAKGGRMPRRAFVLQAAERPGPPRIGYTVTKKVGNAVERNRIRRRLRAAVRASCEAARPDVNYVLIGRRGALSQDFAALAGDIHAGLQRASTTPSDGSRHGKRGARSKSTPVPKKQG